VRHRIFVAFPRSENSITGQGSRSYDIFIGLLWTHFGTPTSDAGSGTEHEFERAYRRFQDSPDDVRIMLYFKDAPVNPTEINPAELQKVSAFKVRVGKLGAYYWPYKTPDEFGNLVRGHLTRQVQTFRKSWGSRKGAGHSEVTRTAVPNPSVQAIAAETIQLGFIELLQVANDNFDQIPQSSERIRQTGEDIKRRVEQRTAELAKGSAIGC
jgi:hypothetical protein